MRRLSVISALVLPLTLTAWLSPATAAGERLPEEPAGKAPSVVWGSCPRLSEGSVAAGWQCGTLEVPLSYATGSRQTVRLALARRPARGPGRRLGVLFGNPGGPGADGLSFTGLFQTVVGRTAERYDLVTWDPRGVGHSRPSLRCGPQERMEELYTHQADTRTDKGVREKIRTDQETARLCRANAGSLLSDMSTMDTVHDLDRLRRALGRPKLDYIGFSYGTVIGAVYANRFPGSTGRMVLHGVVDARLWLNDLPGFMRSDTVQGERTLRAALRACDAHPGDCAFAGGANRKFDRLVGRLRPAGAQVPDVRITWRRLVHDALVVSTPGTTAREAARDLQAMYGAVFQNRPYRQALPETEIALPTWRLPAPYRRDPDGYSFNMYDSRNATLCLDFPAAPADPGWWLRRVRGAERDSRVFGAFRVLDNAVCAGWPAHQPRGYKYTGPWNRSSTRPLIVNERWDNATPLAWAQAMRAAMGPGARLVVNEGFGHGAVTRCSVNHVSTYFLTGRRPADGTVCRGGHDNPFKGD
ncbi:alpha/beta fold hydrolase [Streptomyces sp. AV19]|uniref:alpha/beta hydrolase n=1 Tax=Streptomyces sp. AV19 TaxID=2793068 RepID=UPI0018FE1E4D|nr:alpha/beta hydrolase [Streptomyces sp. AV19]MBH1938855.1 alpha/beta fold hydrolase [Streptomyces sp. AV19]MDG4533526.1 alpha/beta hydrolase [Streptomyces sp. AV19]